MFIKKLLSWLLPYTCILCRNISHREQDLCTPCLLDLPSPQTVCKQCAISLPTGSHALMCGQCLQTTYPFDATFALYDYHPPIDKLLLELKFNQALVNARILGELMAEKLMTTWYKEKPLPEVIIPVPLHPKRLKERGYNQALEIARPVAKLCRIPIDMKSCQRIKFTSPQAMLASKKRDLNIKNAFSSNLRFDNQTIAVIDDVITTGNTIREFCQLLKKQGAKQIDVWCVARAQPIVY